MSEVEKQYMRRADAAAYLKEKYGSGSTQTLAKLACIGGGPTFRKFGRFPVYAKIDLEAWAHARTSPPVKNTSEIYLQ